MKNKELVDAQTAAEILEFTIDMFENLVSKGVFSSSQDLSGVSYFLKKDILQAKKHMDEIKKENETGVFTLPHVDDDVEPPLL